MRIGDWGLGLGDGAESPIRDPEYSSHNTPVKKL